jgi:ABC-2 type transport system ATP-binding protein
VFLDEPTAALDPEAAFVVREAIETLRRAGRTIVLATHNLDEADRLCDRIAFIRGGLLRIDSPAALRGAVGDAGLTVRLRDGVSAEAVSAVRGVPGVRAAQPTDGLLHIGTDDPEAVAPPVVRALVASGADIVEVRPERPSLERIYFEIMGVTPGGDADADVGVDREER